MNCARIWNPANKSEPVIKNETDKLLGYFEIHTDPPISARRPDLVLIYENERTGQQVDFAVPVDHI